MQNEGPLAFDAQTTGTTDCAFCQYSATSYILKQTPAFLIVADFAPLVEGHLLIIPRDHYPCYGAVPAALDDELLALKQEVGQFLARYYAPVVFWEHGVFRQTVFHAHLHCFPFGEIEYNQAQERHGVVVHSQQDIRDWYASNGNYFYMESIRGARLFAPDLDLYWQVIKTIFVQGIANRNGSYHGPRTPQQRYEEGPPLIEAVVAHWRAFQQQEQAKE